MSSNEMMGAEDSPTTALIVGAGIIGAATAYFLSREGVDVTLVEREHPGWGASGRSAGYVSMISRAPGPQLELANLSRSLYEELAAELQSFDFRGAGALVYFFEDQLPLIDGFVQRRKADGLPLVTVDGDTAREMCPLLPDDVIGGVHSLSDAYIHPQKLVDALVDGAVRHGARVVESDVLGLNIRSGRCTGVRTTTGELDGDVVALTAGSWTEALLREAGYPFNLIQIRMQLAETAPVGVRFEPQLYGPTLFHEYVFIRDLPEYDDDLVMHPLQRIMPAVGLLELFAQRADGRLLLGCPVEFVDGADAPPLPTVAGLAQMFGVLGDHVPALQQIPVERIWGGITPQVSDGLPVMDQMTDVEGLFIGAGHGYGATVGPGSGKVLADLILGRAPSIDATPFKYDRAAVTEATGRVVAFG